MKRLMTSVMCVFAATAAVAADLFFAGDSTLHPRRGNPSKEPYELVLASWGDETAEYLRGDVKVRNHALSGASTKSFRDMGRWAGLLKELKAGDWVVIEFGHNDQKVDKPELGTRADSTYRENLRRMVAEVRAKGAKPLLCSSIVRHDFGADGKLKEHCHPNGFRLSDYCAAAAAVAKELDVPFVDMQALTHAAVERAGAEKSLLWYRAGFYPEKGDHTHPTLKGAKVFAKLFADEVKAKNVPIVELFDTGWTWYAGEDLPLEGRGYEDVERYFSRLPVRACGVVNKGLWGMGKQSTGMFVRFTTDAERLRLEWRVESEHPSDPLIPEAGLTGLDVYRQASDGSWEFAGMAPDRASDWMRRMAR